MTIGPTVLISMLCSSPTGSGGSGGTGAASAGPNHARHCSVEPWNLSPSTGALMPDTLALSLSCHRLHCGHVRDGQLGVPLVYCASHSEVVESVSLYWSPSCSLMTL